MAKDAWTRDELFEGLDPAPGFVTELERLDLLVVVGRDGQGTPLYASEAREELEKVLDLVELGYQPADIAAISRRVGLPAGKRRRFRRPPVHLRGQEVAERAGVRRVQFDAWVAAGLLTPSLRSDCDAPLYALSTVTRAERLRDLAVLGVTPDALSAWTQALDWLDTRRPIGAMSTEQAADIEHVLQVLHDRLGTLGETAGRWRRLAATFRKRFARLRPGTDGRPKRGRGRSKTKTRTR